MAIFKQNPKRPMFLWLALFLIMIVTAWAFPAQRQWIIARYLVNSAKGYELYLQQYPSSPQAEKALWLLANLKNEPALYLDFAADYPKNPNHELALWRAAKLSREPAVFTAYLDHYPEGKVARQEGANVNRIRITATVYKNEQKRLAGLNFGKVVDQQGNTYRSIHLGKLIWLADNLNVYIPGLSSCFKNHPAYCTRFGKLYSWLGAQEACTRLGPGWRLPNLVEWEDLCHLYDPAGNLEKGSIKVFGALLKGGKSGFEVRGGGYFTPEGGFQGVYYDAGFWTNQSAGNLEAFEIVFLGREKKAFKALAEQGYGLSCRCVRDSSSVLD